MTQTSTQSPTPLCHIVTPVGCLGYGLDEAVCDSELLRLTIQNDAPIAIILDAGSTDSGPARLGLGKTAASQQSYTRDLGKLIKLVYKYGVPLLFSSAGGDGAGEHVDAMVEIIRKLVDESDEKYNTKVLTVHSDIQKSVVIERLRAGAIRGCGPAVPALEERDVDNAVRIVAQMGAEPFIDAIFAEPDFNILVAGRAYDPAPFVGYCAVQAMKTGKTALLELGEKALGGFFHMGKIMECGAQCATPKSRAARATVYVDGTFDVSPLENGVKCTPLAVAAHTLYEKSRPDLLHGPGGCLDLSQTTYEALPDGKTVRAKGALFKHILNTSAPYNVKLEAARVSGFRSMYVGAFRDPILTGQLDSMLKMVEDYCRVQHKHVQEKWDVTFHRFGATNQASPGEVCIIGEVFAETQSVATAVAETARVACIHGPYPGQKATSGNFAFGIGGKNEIECGPCAQFCIYHLMDLHVGEEGSFSNISDVAALFRSTSLIFGSDNKPVPIGTTTKMAGSSNGLHEVSTTTSSQAVPALGGIDHQKVLTTLGELAQVVRSKNAGPYEITFDLLFAEEDTYRTIKGSSLLTSATIASLYSLNESDIIYCGFFDQARGFKATIPRMRDGTKYVSGGFGDEDVHGSQMYLPLMQLPLPEELQRKFRKA